MMQTSARPHARTDIHGIAFGLLWAFIFCVPWEEEVVVPNHLALSHFIGAGAAIMGLLVCVLRRRIRRPEYVHYLAGSFVFWAALSYCWTIAEDLTIARAASYIQLLFMVWLIWEFAPTLERQMSLVTAYVLGTWVAALSTIYYFASGTGRHSGMAADRYTGTGANENELGIILALGLAMSCYLLAKTERFRFFWLASLPVFLIAILLTGSRGSVIATTVALLLVPFCLGRFTAKAKWVGGVALLLTTGLAAAALPEATWYRVQTIPEELTQGTLTKRTYIWSAGLEAYRQHPVVGVGAGAFEASVYKQLDIAYVAHNSYLSVLVELGIVGMILFGGLLASLAFAACTLTGVPRAAWVILLLTWGVAVSSVTWEHRKPTWFLFGLLMAQSASLRSVRPGVSKAVRLSIDSATAKVA